MDLDIAKEITLGDQTLFNSYFQKFPPQTSEFTFTNLYMWRNFYGFTFMEWREHLLLFSKDVFEIKKIPASGNKKALYFFPPIGPNPAEIIVSLFEELKNLEFHRVPEGISDNVRDHNKFSSLGIEILEDKNNWDYVYEADYV